MKVLLASSSSGSRGGGEKFLIHLGKGLVSRGNQVALWVSNHPRMDELCAEFKAACGPVLRSRYRNTYDYPARSLATAWSPLTSRRIAREWSNSGCDVVHINKQNLEDGLDLLEAGGHCRLPSICTIHLTQTALELEARYAFLRDWVARWALSRYQGKYVTVEESREMGLRLFLMGSQGVECVDNGVERYDRAAHPEDRLRVRKERGWEENAFVVCSVGRMVEQKRPLLFLEVARKFVEQDESARFLWVGDGVLSPLWDEQVRRLGLEGRVCRLPWQAEVKPYLGGSDMYLHTAAYEGAPFALLEAMGAGLPCVVAKDLLESMSILTDGEVIPFDPRRGLSAVELAPDRLREAALAGLRAVEERFSLARMSEKYEALYHEAVLLPRE
jgi:glycosyltransferase involved in cell wall biosynthesis